MSVEQYTKLRLFDMLYMAYVEHKKQYMGRPPLGFGMHPCLKRDLLSDERIRASMRISDHVQDETLFGVPLYWNIMVMQPVMMTDDGRLELI